MLTNFELEVEEKENDIVIMKIKGELDALVAHELKQKFIDLLEEDKKNFIVDFSELTHINSLAMGILRGRLKDAQSSGGDIKLSNLNDHISNIFEMVGLDELFEIYDSNDEAVKAYK
ncbi:MAG: STAS domain-containing protein [Fusobacteriota bacterium]